MLRFPTFCISLFLLVSVNLCQAQETAKVELFSPQGTVKAVRQVNARFSEPMTTFGDPRNESPFEISCPEKGSGRWADVKNWVYDFDRDLPAGVSCTFRLREGLTALSKTVVGGERQFSFTTGGPAIISSRPGRNSTIDEDQIFILTLDGEADEASVLANVHFSVEGIAEPLGIQIVKGVERTSVLKAANRPDNSKVLTIRCRQRFPNKAKIKLVWGKGVKSLNSTASTDDQLLEFNTRDRFTVSFSCDRTNASAPCIPMLPMQLRFSAPVPAKMAKKIVMKSGKKTYKPTMAADDEDGEPAAKTEGDVRGIKFSGPFPEKSSFVIDLPKGLTDDAGRSPANRDKFPLHVSTDSFPPLAKFAAPFGIVELSNETAVPVTLRNIEPKVKARQLDPDNPKKSLTEKSAETVGTVIDKAAAAKDKVVSWITGAKPTEQKPEVIKGKQQLVPLAREEKIIEWLRKVRTARRYKPILANAGAEELTIPKPNGEKAFEVVGIPIKKPGFHIIEIESPMLGSALLGKPRPMYVSTAALVTNMSAHFKWGRESSVVWVTSLDKGQPVANAEVHIRDCRGKLHWQGKTDGDGIARVNTKLTDKLPFCSDSNRGDKEEDYYADNEQAMLQGMSGGLFVFARKQDDLTFVHSSWDQGIESWRFNLNGREFREQTIAHTVFDRTLVRAGDTVHMKHFIRNHAMKGFDLRKVTDLPQAVLVQHRGSGQHYEFPLSWKPDNSAETTMTLPKGAELGFYDVQLLKKPLKKSDKPKGAGNGGPEAEPVYGDGWESGYFRVEEFRIPLMKGVVEPPKEPAVNASSIDVDLYVSHLSGGGASGAPVKLRTQTRPRSVSFSDYEEFSFANGRVETGVMRNESPYHSSDDDEEDLSAPNSGRQKKSAYQTRELLLDQSGGLRTKIENLPKISSPHTVLAELEFRDPNGEIQTVTGRIPLWSSRLLVGIKPDSWASTADALKFKAVVLDLKGQPVSGAKVNVEMFNRRNFSHRKRLVGGFYSYEHVTETKLIGPVCSGTTNDKGLLDCNASSPVSGNLILQASVTDDKGNISTANRDIWIAGKDEWWFETGDSDRIDLLPEKKSYDPGETAKLQVRSPFRNATVLVTVEREGVMDAYLKKISGKEPVISVPIKGNYAPNIFVSALCVRGRVPGTKPTALFDPGKPSYRLGIGEIKVGIKAHELKVNLSTDSETYKVRSKAKVRIRVTRHDGSLPPKGAEVAVAAVDEGLLELMPNNSWKLLEAMMGRRGHEIQTSTAQMQVVGRRHFGLKALPAGGGGGMRSTREMFDTLLTWKGRVKLDAKGEALLEIPLNDSLTSFSIVGIATAGTSMFGTGKTSIRTTQDLMLLAGLPPLVRQGDRFNAGFTVRNASNREMGLTVTAKPSWSDGTGFAPIKLKLAPGAVQEVSWPAEVPVNTESATWEAQVKEDSGDGFDKIKVSQKVTPAVQVQVYQATITQLDKAFEMDLKIPSDAIKGRGGINVVVRPKLTEGLSGVVEYMKKYPYTCMEQQVSRAISLKDDALWRRIVATLPSYIDNNGLVKYFPSTWLDGSPMLTAYILSISKEAGRELPEHLATQMEDGLTAFVNGRIRINSSFRGADLSIQKLAAVEALAKRGRSNAKLLSSIAIEPNLWPTSALLDWLSILKHTEDIPDRQKRLKEAEQIIRSRLNFQGTIMNYSTEQSDRLWWLMVSTDTNALRTLLAFMDENSWKSDIPRLVRGAVARQHHGKWETTIANAWGVVTMDRFTAKFESTPVTGTTRAELAGTSKTNDWNSDKKGKALPFPWPEGGSRLGIQHNGNGKPWITVMSLAAIPLKEQLSSGYRIKKSLIPVEQKDKSRWSRGDVARVRLEIEAQSDMTWVVISDPIPAGSTILGSGLGRDSTLVSVGSVRNSWPVFEERSFEAYRAYYEYLPKGKLVTEYTVRFNNDGSFRLPATRVEAMYAPEMFGEAPNQTMKVGE